MRRWLLVVALVVLPSCAWMQEPCPCGQTFGEDPWTEEALGIDARHPTSIHCVCRCGDGPPVLEDPSARCDLYEGDCTEADGRAAAYVCD